MITRICHMTVLTVVALVAITRADVSVDQPPEQRRGLPHLPRRQPDFLSRYRAGLPRAALTRCEMRPEGRLIRGEPGFSSVSA